MTDIITVDFETEGIKNAPDYPPRPVGVAVKRGRRKPEYFAWGHSLGGNTISKDGAARMLRDIWRGPDTVLFHNAQFDLEVYRRWFRGPERPSAGFQDTLIDAFLYDPSAQSLGLKPLAARLLNEPPAERDKLFEWIRKNVSAKEPGAHISAAPVALVGEYACGDVSRTYAIHQVLEPYISEEKLYEARAVEIELLPTIMRMEREGVRIDYVALDKDTAIWEQELTLLHRKLVKALGDIKFSSGFQLVEALITKNKVHLDRDWPLTETAQRSASGLALQHMVKDPRLLKTLDRYRHLTHMVTSFCYPWLDRMEASGHGRLYPRFNSVRGRGDKPIGTRSGRFSSTDPNFQQLNRAPTDPTLPYMRKYLLPEDRHVLLSRDFDQQELRILADYEDGAMKNEYLINSRADFHNSTLHWVRELTGVAHPRPHIKITGFTVLYGGGAGRIADSIGVSREEADKLKRTWLNALPGVKRLIRQLKQEALDGKPVRTRGGRLYYPIPGKEYVQLNRLVQGSAADHTKRAMLRINKAVRQYGARILLTVHDEIVVTCPEKHVIACNKVFKRAMEFRYFDVPTPTTCKIGPNWGDLKGVAEDE